MTSTCIRIKLRQEIGADYPDITGRKTTKGLENSASFFDSRLLSAILGRSVSLPAWPGSSQLGWPEDDPQDCPAEYHQHTPLQWEGDYQAGEDILICKKI